MPGVTEAGERVLAGGPRQRGGKKQERPEIGAAETATGRILGDCRKKCARGEGGGDGVYIALSDGIWEAEVEGAVSLSFSRSGSGSRGGVDLARTDGNLGRRLATATSKSFFQKGFGTEGGEAVWLSRHVALPDGIQESAAAISFSC